MNGAPPVGNFADNGAKTRGGLWPLVLGPAIWALYFLISYVTAAVWCAKAAAANGVPDVPRLAIAGYTLAALLGIAGVAAGGWRRYRAARAADSRRFLGFTTMLLCGLSGIATVYVALPILFIRSCH